MTLRVTCLFFYIAILTNLSAPLRNVCAYNTLKWTIETKPSPTLSSQESQNLKQMLNFIKESPEFRPLTLSILLPEFQSSAIEFLLRYVAENSIEAYTISTLDQPSKSTWMDRVLTWTLIVRDVHSLNIFVRWKQELWKARNQYVIIFASKGVTVPWGDVFKHLWRKYRVYRAVALSVQDDFRCLLRYMPFDRGETEYGRIRKLCLKTHVAREPKSLQTFYANNPKKFEDIEKVLTPGKDVRIFENFRNLNNYPVNIVVFESLFMNVSYDNRRNLKLGKVDAEVLFVLEKVMKAKFHIKAMRKVEFRKYDPFDLSLMDIESGDAEMVITGFFMKTYDKHREFQFTCAVYEDRLCFLSPDSGLVPKAYMPFLPFEKNLWFLLITYNIAITLLWCLMKYASQSQRQQSAELSTSENSIQGNKRTHSLLNQLGVSRQLFSPSDRKIYTNQPRRYFMNVSNLSSRVSNRQLRPPDVPHYLQKFFSFLELLCYPIQTGDTPAQRALFIGIVFFGLIVNGLYQSCLVSSLSKPFHYPQLHTVEDVLGSGKQLITKYANLRSVFLDDSALDRKLSQRIHVINSNVPTKDMVAFENKIAVSRYYSMVLGAAAYYDKEGNPLLWVVDECPMMYRVSYVLNSQSPYKETVNFVLLKLREGGVLSFWFENMTYRLTIVKMRRKLQVEKRTIKLTLGHYSLTFLLLFVGLFGSTLVFFGELYIARRAWTERRAKPSAGTVFPSGGLESMQRARDIQ